MEAVAKAIEDMVVRGAPAIGCAAAWGLAIDAINHTDKPTSFDCQLFIPERRNERIQIASVETRKTRTVVLPKANELVYKTLWLRCVQLGTRRILNYRIAIEPEAADSSTDGGGKIP